MGRTSFWEIDFRVLASLDFCEKKRTLRHIMSHNNTFHTINTGTCSISFRGDVQSFECQGGKTEGGREENY